MHPLRKYLADSGLTQMDLGRLSGVSQSAISKVCTGKRKSFTWKDAVKIHKAIHGAVALERLTVPPEAFRRKAG